MVFEKILFGCGFLFASLALVLGLMFRWAFANKEDLYEIITLLSGLSIAFSIAGVLMMDTNKNNVVNPITPTPESSITATLTPTPTATLTPVPTATPSLHIGSEGCIIGLSDSMDIVNECIKREQRREIIDEYFDFVAKIVESEAYGCTYEQKLNVASVIFNRTVSSHWPNSTYEVCSQLYQFEVFTTGFYKLVDPSEDTIKALYSVIENGPANNAEFFCTPAASKTSPFFKKLKPDFFDGAHNFYSWK